MKNNPKDNNTYNPATATGRYNTNNGPTPGKGRYQDPNYERQMQIQEFMREVMEERERERIVKEREAGPWDMDGQPDAPHIVAEVFEDRTKSVVKKGIAISRIESIESTRNASYRIRNGGLVFENFPTAINIRYSRTLYVRNRASEFLSSGVKIIRLDGFGACIHDRYYNKSGDLIVHRLDERKGGFQLCSIPINGIRNIVTNSSGEIDLPPDFFSGRKEFKTMPTGIKSIVCTGHNSFHYITEPITSFGAEPINLIVMPLPFGRREAGRDAYWGDLDSMLKDGPLMDARPLVFVPPRQRNPVQIKIL